MSSQVGQWVVFAFSSKGDKDAWCDKARAAGLLTMSRDGMFAANVLGDPFEAAEFILNHVRYVSKQADKQLTLTKAGKQDLTT